MTPPAAAAFRLARHRLAARARDPVDACRAACGIQSQVDAVSALALVARTEGLTRGALDDALYRRRTLVKTSAMRQTLHLLPSDELAIYLAALRRGRRAAMDRVAARVGASPRDLDRLVDDTASVLAAGPLTKREITERVAPCVAQSLRQFFERIWSPVRAAIIEGHVVYGPLRDGEATYVLTRDWLPPLPALDEDEARVLLLRRYLAAYGPATPRDFAFWSGLSAAESAAAFAALDGDLVRAAGGALLRDDADAAAVDDDDHLPLRLLPRFDPFLLAHSDKSWLIDREYYKSIWTAAGWVAAVVLAGGRIAGTWTHALRAGRVTVEIAPFAPLSADDLAAARDEAAHYAAFLKA